MKALQAGSDGRWHITENGKVVATYRDETLARRLVASSNRHTARLARRSSIRNRPVPAVVSDTELVLAARAELDRKYWPHIDVRFGNVLEMVMHAMEEYKDRHEA